METNDAGLPSQAATGAERRGAEWENEGGSFRPAVPEALPEGITAETTTRYRVGPYTYTRLEDALAEHARQSRR